MKTETKTIMVLAALVVILVITTMISLITAKDMSNTAAYHNAVQYRLEQTLINMDKSYSDSIVAIKYQEYNRIYK